MKCDAPIENEENYRVAKEQRKKSYLSTTAYLLIIIVFFQKEKLVENIQAKWKDDKSKNNRDHVIAEKLPLELVYLIG